LDSREKNLIILLGPTSVGKSKTSIKIAKKFPGEIINCDSMQVYKGFDIGTDKLPFKKREGIRHHLIDIVEPATQFTAADFVSMALKAIESILSRGKLPIIVGGTGLYLKSLLDGLFPGGKSRPEIRQKLEREAKEKGLELLWNRLKEIDPDYSKKIGENDKIRIIRALEVFYSTEKILSEHFSKTHSFVKDFHILKIGLKLERKVLYKKIEERVDKMFERGIVDEAQALRAAGVAEDAPPFRALGYKYVLKFLNNEMSFEEAKSLTKRDTRHYAKRQMTWFRKTEGTQWFSPLEFPSIAEYIEKNLK
jgi:tRNA dimethylallyltransferase